MKLLTRAFVSLMLATPVVGLAQVEESPVQVDASVSTLGELFGIVETLINWVLYAALLIGVVVLIIGGIRYMLAGGDEEEAGQAMQWVIYAIIGVAIAGLAFAIVQIVGNIFGFETQTSQLLINFFV